MQELNNIELITNVDPDVFRRAAGHIMRRDVQAAAEMLPTLKQLSSQLTRLYSYTQNMVNSNSDSPITATSNPSGPSAQQNAIPLVTRHSRAALRDMTRERLPVYRPQGILTYTRCHVEVDAFIQGLR
jgi:hypothetical protein